MKSNKLTIELIPRTSFYRNVRSNVSKQRWDELRKYCYQKANHKCEICGDTGKKQGYDHNVECHEVWDYDDKRKIQSLVRLIALCPKCHKVKHIGLAQINGEEDMCRMHLMKVNNISEFDADNYIEDSFQIWLERSDYDWQVDISWLDNNGDQLTDLLTKMNKFRK